MCSITIYDNYVSHKVLMKYFIQRKSHPLVVYNIISAYLVIFCKCTSAGCNQSVCSSVYHRITSILQYQEENVFYAVSCIPII